jgi:uncharacterized protein YjiS (DUF1127 family)
MLRRIYNYLIKYQEKRVAIWQINNLTDSQLKDIGYTRSQLHEAAYGKRTENKVKSKRSGKLYKALNAQAPV